MTSSGNQKPPVSEQIAEFVLKVMTTGGIPLGSVGAYWQFFHNNDTRKAVLSVIIGGVISYGSKMMGPIHQGNEARAEEAGKTINTKINSFISRLTAVTAGIKNQYLDCQASDVQDFCPEGASIINSLPLEGIFVQPDIATEVIQKRLKPPQVKDVDSKSRTIWYFLENAQTKTAFRQIALLGRGGYGKTMLLHYVTFYYSTKEMPKGVPKLIPFLLVLRHHQELLVKEPATSLEELITYHSIPGLPDSEQLSLPQDWALRMLRNGNALVMFDGFDEVSVKQRSEVALWLKKQMNRFSKAIFILASRPDAYIDQVPSSRLTMKTSLWLQDFDAKRRREFVTQWYRHRESDARGRQDTPETWKHAAEAAEDVLKQIENTSQDALQDLARNPLLLDVVVKLHRKVPGARLIDQQMEICKVFCKLQLIDRPRARDIAPTLKQCNDPLDVLQQIAFEMTRGQQKQISKVDLLKKLDRIIQKQNKDFSAKSFLTEIVQVSEILIRRGDIYEFSHSSFQKYLAKAYSSKFEKGPSYYPDFIDN